MNSKKMYTLIELLVTITIMGILATMLISTMKVAIEKKKAVDCVGNGKNLMMQVFAYSSDNRGKIPQPQFDPTNYWGDGGGVIGWDDKLLPYYGYRIDQEYILEDHMVKEDVADAGDFNEFLCPGDDYAASSDNVLISYSMHMASGMSNTSFAGTKDPWHYGYRRGIGFQRRVRSGGNINQRTLGYAANLGLINQPSESIAFAEVNNGTPLGGVKSMMNIEKFKDYTEDDCGVGEDMTVEEVWTHGFGKTTIMLCDGAVRLEEIDNTVDSGFDYLSDNREEDNGLWDCWRGKKSSR